MLEAPRVTAVPEGVERLFAICAYAGAGRELVLALKRGNRRGAVPLMGSAIAESVAGATTTRRAFGVTWAPTTRSRARERGFDQAEVLARAVAKALGLRGVRCLERVGGPQMGHGALERRANTAFTALGRLAGTWLVVDDVVTTGSTMAHAAQTLRSAGASRVLGAAIAVA
ncbi:MAG: ComF family protein [Microthrixaceae bacterium]